MKTQEESLLTSSKIKKLLINVFTEKHSLCINWENAQTPLNLLMKFHKI